jgi:probable F420-dependent oxidoreductase
MDPALPLSEVAAHARRVEALGYDGLHVAEMTHDSLAVALLALEHTRTLTVRTAVTLAFPRSPTLTAYAAWDLAAVSAGRFQLGLGTQIRQNVEERFGVAFDDPVGRMADYLDALEALFAAFAGKARLDHRGPYWRLTRLQPEFTPAPLPPGVGPPPVWLGGVNRGLCRLAGARAAGLVTHPTNTDPAYLAEVCRPALAEGAAAAGRDLGADGFELVAGALVVTGPDQAGLGPERERLRRTLGFLYSTPAYGPALERLGRADLAPRLRRLLLAREEAGLAAAVDDELLDTVVTTAPFDQVADRLAERYAALADGLLLPVPARPSDDAAFAPVVAALRAVPGPGPVRPGP